MKLKLRRVKYGTATIDATKPFTAVDAIKAWPKLGKAIKKAVYINSEKLYSHMPCELCLKIMALHRMCLVYHYKLPNDSIGVCFKCHKYIKEN